MCLSSKDSSRTNIRITDMQHSTEITFSLNNFTLRRTKLEKNQRKIRIAPQAKEIDVE